MHAQYSIYLIECIYCCLLFTLIATKQLKKVTKLLWRNKLQMSWKLHYKYTQ